MVVVTGATAWTTALPGGIASTVAMMGIASMVVMTGTTAWTGVLSGGITSMVAMTGATASTGVSSSSPPCWR